MPRPRVLIADDHVQMRAAIARLLQAESCEVVGEVGDGRSLLNAIDEAAPDVAVIDISMPVMDGLEAAEQLKGIHCSTKIVILTVHGDPEFLRAAMAMGALGYVLKYRVVSDLPLAIERALADLPFVSPPLADFDLVK